MAALRWASEEALALYKLTTPSAYGSWLIGAEQARITVHRAHHLPRPMPRYDHYEHAAAILGAREPMLTRALAVDNAADNLTRLALFDGAEAW